MIFIPVVAVLAVCWHSFVILHGQWTDWSDTTHTHGYLIVAICIWLLWRQRKQCNAKAQSYSTWRIWPLAAVMICWLFAVMAGIQTAELLLVPLVLWCAIGAGFGWPSARHATFAVGYFVFALPVWGLFNGLFQWSSVYAVRGALRLVGVPAYFDENRVHIPEGTFEIAGGCSGLHFVVVAAAIAALMGELRRDAMVGRIKLLALAVGLAMLTNWIRIVVIVEAGHLTNMQHYLVTVSHYGFGWLVFALCMAVFYWIESRMPAPKRPVIAHAVAAVRWQTILLAVVPVLGLSELWHSLASRPADATLEEPRAAAGWSIGDGAPTSWQPLLAGVDDSDRLLYRRDDGAVIDAYFGLYRSQGQGKEFTAYGNDLHPGAGTVDADVQTFANVPFVVQRVRDGAGQEYLVAATYRVGNTSFANAGRAQLWYALSALVQMRSPASRVLLLRTACSADCTGARQVLRDWKEGT